jgi:short-subunit dehydrogenase
VLPSLSKILRRFPGQRPSALSVEEAHSYWTTAGLVSLREMLGEAIAGEFAAAAAKVVLSARDLTRVEVARRRVGFLDRTIAFACDVRDRGQLECLLRFTLERFGSVGVWVNNAGFGLIDSILRMEMEAVRAVFETNLFGAIEAMQLVSAEYVAKATLRACLANKREIVVPWYYNPVIWLYRMFPSFVNRKMLAGMKSMN